MWLLIFRLFVPKSVVDCFARTTKMHLISGPTTYSTLYYDDDDADDFVAAERRNRPVSTFLSLARVCRSSSLSL